MRTKQWIARKLPNAIKVAVVFVLKVISEHSIEQFEDGLSDARAKAKKAKLKPGDVKEAVKHVRRK